MIHALFESLSYALGFFVFRWLRRRDGHPTDHPDGGWVLVGAAVGAALGAKLLGFAQYASHVLASGDPTDWLAGKTIVGGLLGGWVGVEIAKRRVGIVRSTGDLLVAPLIVGMIVGRVGCFLEGPDDHTGGSLTTVPWAVDGRHPAPLYEILALLALLPLTRLRAADGARFRLFYAGYLGFRVLVDFLKAPFGPDPVLPHPDVWLGLTPIQWAAAAGVGAAVATLPRATFGSRPDPA